MERENNGITLIAMVITIIVLLILAGIVINLTIGEKGILKRAEQSGVAYSESEARESLELVLFDMQAEKIVNSAYDKDLYLTRKLEEKGMVVNGDIVIVNGWQFTINRDVPQIGESLGKGQKNEAIKITVEQTISTDYVKSTLKVEIEYEGEISSIKIAGEEVAMPEKKEGKYVVEKEIMNNGIYNVLVKDSNEGYQIASEQVSQLTENMEIWNLEDMILFRDRVNSGRTYQGKKVYLKSNIDLSSVCNEKIGSWIPMVKFAGELDGEYHTISNLYIKDNNKEKNGLFETILEGGIIQKIILNSCKIDQTMSSKNMMYIGMLSARNEGKIFQCRINEKCMINGKNISEEEGVTIGGIVGVNSGIVEQCINEATLGAGLKVYDYQVIIGGIAGSAGTNSVVRGCYNVGNINCDISGGCELGGIVGQNNGEISKDYSIGEIKNVTAKYYNMIAAIIGANMRTEAKIENIYHLNTIRYSYNNCTGSKIDKSFEVGSMNEIEMKGDVLLPLLGDVFTSDVQNKDGTWKYNNGYPILKWQLEE